MFSPWKHLVSWSWGFIAARLDSHAILGEFTGCFHFRVRTFAKLSPSFIGMLAINDVVSGTYVKTYANSQLTEQANSF
jgi:hypothetical protein